MTIDYKTIIFLFMVLVIINAESFILKKEIDIKYMKVYWILCIIPEIFFILFLFMDYVALIYPFLLGQTMIDFYKMELSDYNNLCLFLLSLVYGKYNGWNIKSLIIISIFFLVLFFLPFSELGFGDVKLSISIALMIPFKIVPSFIFYSLVLGFILGIFYKNIKKKDSFPMGPCIVTMCIFIQIMETQKNCIQICL